MRRLVEAGMDVARLNFSHGSRESHERIIADLRAICKDLQRPIGIVQDLQGPKLRTGTFADGAVELRVDDAFILAGDDIQGDQQRVSTNFPSLSANVASGDHIQLRDGLLRLTAERVEGRDIHCRVDVGEVLMSRSGIHIPRTIPHDSILTEKDKEDLKFGLHQGVDYVAVSFIRQAADVAEVNGVMEELGIRVPVIAKIEKPQALENLEEILAAADAVMIARGDLGVEMPAEQVPFIQKRIIRAAARHKKPVVTATQMLESMIEHPRPTRAEASDVANAILDGTDAVMLSGETAVGKHPVAAATIMDRIVREAERHLDFLPDTQGRRASDPGATFPDAVAQSACRAGAEVEAAAIVAFTQSGFTARLLSKCRPATPVIAVTFGERILRQLCLYWGVQPRLLEFDQDANRMLEVVDAQLRDQGVIASGDRLVVVAGEASGTAGTTNLMRLHVAGEHPA